MKKQFIINNVLFEVFESNKNAYYVRPYGSSEMHLTYLLLKDEFKYFQMATDRDIAKYITNKIAGKEEPWILYGI